MDARALASPNLTVLLAGNKTDLADATASDTPDESTRAPPTPSSTSSKQSSIPWDANGSVRSNYMSSGTRMTATFAEGREVSREDTTRWAAQSNIPVAVEVSALTGDGVEEVFQRLARIILTKIELGEIDPDDPQSGIQYGDGGLYGHGTSDVSSIHSRATLEDGSVPLRRTSRRTGRTSNNTQGWRGGMREWEDVFRLGGSQSHGNRGCC